MLAGLSLFYVGAVSCLNGRPMDVPLCTPGRAVLKVPTSVRFRTARRDFFRNVTLLTEKERARWLYMSIGVINMASLR